MLKVAISGKMASGKTTFTNLLQQYHESHIPESNLSRYEDIFIASERLSLAAPVKKVARDYFLMPLGYKDRSLLQQIGQKFRDIRPSVWIDLLIENGRKLTRSYEKQKIQGCLVCDDVRFPNEVSRLKQDGWFLIRLEVDDEIRRERIQRTYSDWETHWENRHEISETALDNYAENWDLLLHNPSIDEVKEAISDFYKRLSHSPHA